MASQVKFCQFINLYGSFRSLFINRPVIVNCQTATITRAGDNLNALPEKPKKPMTSFFFFAETRRPELRKQHPYTKPSIIAKMLGAEWKDVDPSVKEKYDKQYKEAKCEYIAKCREYSDALTELTEEQKSTLVELSKQKKADKKQRAEKKQLKRTNKPKRPKGAFIYFILEKYDNKKSTYADFLKIAKLMWADLTVEEVQKYNDMYMADKKRYELEMQQWEAKMIKEGRSDLVRSRTLQDIKPRRHIKASLSDSSEAKAMETMPRPIKPI